MKVNRLYNFLFHPFSEHHSRTKKVFSAVTMIALSILTSGFYLLIVCAVSLRDYNISLRRWSKGKNKKNEIETIKPKEDESESPKNQVDSPSESPSSKIQKVKSRNQSQVESFEAWAAKNDWERFEYSHYDWWAFPITRGSSSYGDGYSVDALEIEALKSDEEFMRHYRRGVELVIKSWGYDLMQDRVIPEEESVQGQKWIGYGVRLGKMADSLKLFEQNDLYRRVQHFYDRVCVGKYSLEEWVSETLDRKNQLIPYKSRFEQLFGFIKTN